MKKVWKNYSDELVLFVIAFLILQVVGTSGYTIDGDAPQYIAMGGYLPPLYPVFLMCLRGIFGVAHYLTVTVVIQSMLSAASIVCILHFLKKEYNLSFVILGIMMIGLMAPFVRESMREMPKYMLSHTILTEAISAPLFYFYMYSGLVTIKKKNLLSFINLNILSILLMLSRAQFKVCIPLNFAVLLYLIIVQDKKRAQFAVKGVIVIMAAYLATGALEDCYKNSILGTTKNAWNSSYFLLHCMYASNFDDAALYEDEDLQVLYTTLYQNLDEVHYNYKYMPDTIYGKSCHWSEDFSAIYRNLKETIGDYVTEKGVTDTVQQDEMITAYVDGLMNPLMVHNGIKSFGLSLYQFPISMCSNVFLLKEDHLWFSYAGTILIYLFTIIVMIKRWLQKKDSFAVWFMLFLLTFMIGNSLVVGYVLHTQSRYLMYSMGVFYVALGLICLELWGQRYVKTQE